MWRTKVDYRKPMFRRTLLTVAVVSTPMATAQTALEEIIVTAQGRTQSLADVPVAVSVARPVSAALQFSMRY